MRKSFISSLCWPTRWIITQLKSPEWTEGWRILHRLKRLKGNFLRSFLKILAWKVTQHYKKEKINANIPSNTKNVSTVSSQQILEL